MADNAQPMVISAEEYRQRMISQSKSEAAELHSDETVSGGRYLVGDQLVNANGEPIKETKAPAKGDDK